MTEPSTAGTTTSATGSGGGLALRFALALHPAAHRREWGDEIAGVFADATAGAGRLATARELADLAGHGLRVRTGLASSGIPARLAAVVAPFAVGAAAGVPLFELFVAARALVHGNTGVLSPTLEGWLWLAGDVLALLAVVTALFGRWPAAKGLVLLAALTVTSSQVMAGVAHTGPHNPLVRVLLGIFLYPGLQLLWTAMALTAPRDLLGPATLRRAAAVLAGVLLGGVVFTSALFSYPFRLPVDSSLLVLLFAGVEGPLLVVALPALLRGWLFPAAAALAGLPAALMLSLPVLRSTTGSSGTAALILLGGLVLVIGVARLWHPDVPDRRRPPSAG
ncbi:hypothetical protein GCM10009760_23250 [Kitasatospora kazusensis]|uniref:Uncharacterized protein n=1 Tax=Kitasatospora kazusensis TaxID=407974 RepID=A0ABN2ZCR6_9ACTN